MKQDRPLKLSKDGVPVHEIAVVRGQASQYARHSTLPAM